MFRHGGTSERDVGAPLMPFNAFATHRPSCKAYHKRNSNPWLTMASDSRRATDECAVPPLDIGVGAIQLSPYRAGIAGQCYTRLLTFPAFPSCSCSLPFRESGKMGRLEVICLELRPPRVAIRSVRTTAHTFTAPGSPLDGQPQFYLCDI
jgi:hypothetical protein